MSQLWDTDVLSEYMRNKNAALVNRADAYLAQFSRCQFSAITRYEVLRGLKASGASTRLAWFEAWSRSQRILPLTDSIVVIAAEVWAGLARRGLLIGDNDILIAATALHHNLPLATKNVAHFNRVPNLVVEDWNVP